MSSMRGRWMPLAILVAAGALLVGSIVWAAGLSGAPFGTGLMGSGTLGPGGMMGPGMGSVAIAGDEPVHNFDDATRAASRFAGRWDLTVGEVMQFDNGFYAELVEPSGRLATEVLIDPGTGNVQLEFGPGMMWNTAYGVHPARAGNGSVTSEQARGIADRRLAANRSGTHAAKPDAFPGYYTVHILRGDYPDEAVAGMLSVNASTGAVWYHSWHGRFIAMTAHETQ